MCFWYTTILYFIMLFYTIWYFYIMFFPYSIIVNDYTLYNIMYMLI